MKIYDYDALQIFHPKKSNPHELTFHDATRQLLPDAADFLQRPGLGIQGQGVMG